MSVNENFEQLEKIVHSLGIRVSPENYEIIKNMGANLAQLKDLKELQVVDENIKKRQELMDKANSSENYLSTIKFTIPDFENFHVYDDNQIIKLMALGLSETDEFRIFKPKNPDNFLLTKDLMNYFYTNVNGQYEEINGAKYHKSNYSINPENVQQIRFVGDKAPYPFNYVILDLKSELDSHNWGDPSEGQCQPIAYNSITLGLSDNIGYLRNMRCPKVLGKEKSLSDDHNRIKITPALPIGIKEYENPQINVIYGNRRTRESWEPEQDGTQTIVSVAREIKEIIEKYFSNVKTNF